MEAPANGKLSNPVGPSPFFSTRRMFIDQLFGAAGSSLSMIGACHGGLGVGTGCIPFFYKAKMGVPQRRFPPHMMGLWFPCSSFGMSWCTLSDGTDLKRPIGNDPSAVLRCVVLFSPLIKWFLVWELPRWSFGGAMWTKSITVQNPMV